MPLMRNGRLEADRDEGETRERLDRERCKRGVCVRERERKREKAGERCCEGVGTARATEASIIHSVTGRCAFT